MAFQEFNSDFGGHLGNHAKMRVEGADATPAPSPSNSVMFDSTPMDKSTVGLGTDKALGPTPDSKLMDSGHDMAHITPDGARGPEVASFEHGNRFDENFKVADNHHFHPDPSHHQAHVGAIVAKAAIASAMLSRNDDGQQKDSHQQVKTPEQEAAERAAERHRIMAERQAAMRQRYGQPGMGMGMNGPSPYGDA